MLSLYSSSSGLPSLFSGLNAPLPVLKTLFLDWLLSLTPSLLTLLWFIPLSLSRLLYVLRKTFPNPLFKSIAFHSTSYSLQCYNPLQKIYHNFANCPFYIHPFFAVLTTKQTLREIIFVTPWVSVIVSRSSKYLLNVYYLPPVPIFRSFIALTKRNT